MNRRTNPSPRRSFRPVSCGAPRPRPTRSRARAAKTARANPSGTGSRTRRAGSTTATPATSPATATIAMRKTSRCCASSTCAATGSRSPGRGSRRTGRGAPNPKGLDYYKRLADATLDAGIRPLATLYHWDLPQALEDAGGWAERDTAARFADYAGHVVRALGDRVKHWVVFNEPKTFSSVGYWYGAHAPGRKDPLAFVRATHVINLAQGEAVRAIKAIDGVIAGEQRVRRRADVSGDAGAGGRGRRGALAPVPEPVVSPARAERQLSRRAPCRPIARRSCSVSGTATKNSCAPRTTSSVSTTTRRSW